MAVVVAASGAPAEDWRDMISGLLFDHGWRTSRESTSRPTARSATLTVLDIMSGTTSAG